MSVADWMSFINGIPGLGKAVTELLGDVSRLASAGTKLGIAHIEARRQTIEDESASRSALTKLPLTRRWRLSKRSAKLALIMFDPTLSDWVSARLRLVFAA